MPEFRTSWGAVRYSVEGAGPPILLIHGVGARLNNWDDIAGILSRSFTVVRYDLRGHGNTSKILGPYSLEMFANDAEELLNHLNITRTHVAGHSLGGMVAITLAANHPRRVDRLAILSAAAGRTEEESRKVVERIDVIASGIPGDHFRNSLSRWFTDEFRAANPALMEQYATRSEENDPACYAAAYTVLATSEVESVLYRVKSPTLVVTGEFDLGSNPRMARVIHAGITGSELRILPKLRHSILVEAPCEVSRLLEPFFSGHSVPRV